MKYMFWAPIFVGKVQKQSLGKDGSGAVGFADSSAAATMVILYPSHMSPTLPGSP